jgi:ATP-dependent protease ClpP protease subunit
MAGKWYNIKNGSDKAEIFIYDFIGTGFWDDQGISAKNFQKDLATIKAKSIDLHINSPGGDVADGITIYNLIKQHPATVTTYIDGVAASISSVIALAGDNVLMAENALFMIHNPLGIEVGDAETHRKFADRLDIARDAISKAYINKTGLPEDEIHNLMSEETWMDSEFAVENKFVDEVYGKVDMAACAQFESIMKKVGYKNIPVLLNSVQEPTIKDAEKALRDVGFSHKEAKAILSKGIKNGLRDEDQTQRDVEEKPHDRVAELLTKAELICPSN